MWVQFDALGKPLVMGEEVHGVLFLSSCEILFVHVCIRAGGQKKILCWNQYNYITLCNYIIDLL